MKRMVSLLVGPSRSRYCPGSLHLDDERAAAKSTRSPAPAAGGSQAPAGAPPTLARIAPTALLGRALAAPREDLAFLVVGRGAPAHDLRERAAAAHAHVVVVETTSADARRGERIGRRRLHATDHSRNRGR